MSSTAVDARPARLYLAATVLVTGLFVLWGTANNLNDTLIAQFKKAFLLSDFQSGLVQSAFYIGYFVFAMPAAMFMRRYGYRAAVVLGLGLYAAGAFLFYPAAEARTYGFFLGALFVIASGLAFLETSANPLITVMGPPETADRRLNFAQAFNPFGAISGVLIGRQLIFTDVHHTPEEMAAMSPAALDAYFASEASAVQLPYLLLGAVVLVWAVLVLVVKFPPEPPVDDSPGEGGFGALRGRRRYWFGVLAQFAYVGAQVGIWSYIIRYTQHNFPGTLEKEASNYLLVSLVLFAIGRFVGTALMRVVPAARLMGLFAAAALALTLAAVVGGKIGLGCLVASSFFMSIMFPTIFSLSLRGLGAATKAGASFLVMAIVGGAFITAIMGLVSDQSSINLAFLVPAACFACVLAFAATTPALKAGS
jgi:MFS transporter, FHS family, L-fucose permease